MANKLSDSHIAKRGHEYGVQHFLVSSEGTLTEILSRELGLETDVIVYLCDMGAIYINEERFDGQPNQNLNKGDYLRVHSKPRRFNFDPLTLSSLVVFQNDDFVVANKPSGIPVHATVDNRKENLLAVVREQIGATVFVTNRLDIATSGLIILAKSKSFQTLFNDYLKNAQVTKRYRAVAKRAEGLGPSRLVHFMEPSPRAPKLVSTIKQPEWQKCALKILDVKPRGVFSEVHIELETGRTHQIRAQLSAIGAPILGDKMYGSGWASIESRQEIALQSCRLEFPGGFKFKLDDSDWAGQQLRRFHK